jgi:hypothetical protein
MKLIAIAFALLLCCCGKDRISSEHETALKPVIKFVDEFIAKNHRLPTDHEFHETADKMAWMVVLRDNSYPYAASHGATSKLDYMVGSWRADWYHYYKSWDKQFINASDENL